MSEFFIPRKNVARLEMQPHFPHEDLTPANTAVLKFKLANESGLDSYAEALAREQQAIYALATQALNSLDLAVRFEPKGLHAFSHGFAGFESIADMVHPQDKLAYPIDMAIERVSNDVINRRPSADAPVKLARHYLKVVQAYPNTVDVMSEVSESRAESTPELHSRLAGMAFAHSLQTRD